MTNLDRPTNQPTNFDFQSLGQPTNQPTNPPTHPPTSLTDNKQIAFDCAIYYFFGGKAIFYLVFGTLLGMGLHPMAGHFIAEHYTCLLYTSPSPRDRG